MTALKASPQLRKAAERELRRIAAQRDRLDTRRVEIEAELAQTRDELAALDLRAELIDRLIDEPPERVPGDGVAGIVLRGARLREVAIRLLYEQHGYGKVVHYQQWFALLAENGYVVLGKRPLATFLTNVGRSPFVIRGDEPGTYSLNGDAEGRLRQELVEAQAEFSDLCGLIARDGASQADREHRTRLLPRVRMLERQVAEADRIFTPREPREDAGVAAGLAAAT